MSTNKSPSDHNKQLTYGIDKASPGGDETALTIKLNDKLFTFVGPEAEAIQRLIETECIKARLDEHQWHEDNEVYQLNGRPIMNPRNVRVVQMKDVKARVEQLAQKEKQRHYYDAVEYEKLRSSQKEGRDSNADT